MSFNHKWALAAVAAACLVTPQFSQAATQTVTGGAFDSLDDEIATYYLTTSTGSTGGVFMHSNQITGLDKFDPSLGTLTDVTITVSYEFQYAIYLETYSVTPPANPGDPNPYNVSVNAPDLAIFIGVTSSSTPGIAVINSALLGPLDLFIDDTYGP
ncbi:choice-of-anchor E domain-containing protein [Poriferisphaera sp. WC338]|uniref:choice-of-anchor E domain-containing protein n=1 Tax=Poriferisphaera sp. WC338 TaxID=3425129 RepID=UPI003D819AD1